MNRTIASRWGVELPRQALERLLVERLGADGAAALLAELRVAEGRYQRAVRVGGLRRRASWGRGLPARDQLILANATAYIAGTWAPPPPLKKGDAS